MRCTRSFPQHLGRSALAALAIAAAGLALGACGRDDRVPETDTSTAAAGVIDSAPGAALAAVATHISDENVYALLDTAVVAMQQLDSLGLARATDERVRTFASGAVSRAAVTRRGIAATVERLNVRPMLPDRDVVKDHQQRLTQLGGMSGRDFDAAYAARALEMRRGLLDEIDDALEDQGRQQPSMVYLRELRVALEGEIRQLEGLRPAGG